MATNYTCTFTIPSFAGNGKMGGKFTTPVWTPPVGTPGSIYSKHGTPILLTGDSIQIRVVRTGNSTTSLTGNVMLSASQDAPQAGPSPFVQTANSNAYLCFLPLGSVSPSFAGGQTVYLFPQTSYLGGLPGGYEFTFVAQDGSGNQWSEDPEFDTGN